MRLLGLAFALLWVPLTADAQVSSCLSLATQPSVVAPGIGVNVLSAFGHGEDVAVLGWPAYEFERDSSGEHRIIDSLFAGILMRPGATARKIPLPLAGRPFEEPWLTSLSGGGARLLFLVSVPQREPLAARDSIEIWTGVLIGTTWSDLRHLATVGGRSRLHTQAVPAALVHGDSVLFAFGETRRDSRVDGITTLTATRNAWTVQRDTTVWRWVDYVDIVRYRGTFWLAAIGLSRAAERAGEWASGNSVYASRKVGAGWSEPVRVADGTAQSLHEPRLVQASDGLYVLWREDTETERRVHWRGLTPGTDTTTRVSGIHSRLTPGSGAWRDVIAFTTDDSTGVIARPGPGGLIELGRLRVAQRLPPLVVSGPRGPIAVTLTPAPEDPEVDLVSIFDVSCALGPARPDPYRR